MAQVESCKWKPMLEDINVGGILYEKTRKVFSVNKSKMPTLSLCILSY